MTTTSSSIECADCKAFIDESLDTPEARTPCISCGSTKRIHNVSISAAALARDGIGVKGKRAGEKKPFFEGLSIPDHSQSLDKVVHRERLIDRENDQYFERVTDYETGEIIHQCEEPLSQHQGHGSARQQTMPARKPKA